MAIDRPELDARIERLYADRYPALCRLATGITGSAETAHDAVQDGFALALARLGEFRGEGALEGWVWRIVLRSALDSQRRIARQPATGGDDGEAGLVMVPELPHPERDPELDAAVRALPTRQRLVVFLRYFADLTHVEIAEVSGMELGTVSATLHHAKTTLALRLHQTTPANKEIHQ